VRTIQISAVDWVCFGLLIVGAINWGLLGVVQINLIREILTPIFQSAAADALARVLYIFVGLAGLYFFYPLYRISQMDGF
jgi:uncharacterized membrane protein YuzA (DUF378 family)